MSVSIHGHTVEGDPEGLRYLESLSASEIKTLFDEAKMRGKANFKYNNKHFEVAHLSQGTYLVAELKKTTNWF